METVRLLDESTARRGLAALERRHGPAVVGRIGKKLFTTEAGLVQIAPALALPRTEGMRRTAWAIGSRRSGGA
jgi:hypothetical protein